MCKAVCHCFLAHHCRAQAMQLLWNPSTRPQQSLHRRLAELKHCCVLKPTVFSKSSCGTITLTLKGNLPIACKFWIISSSTSDNTNQCTLVIPAAEIFWQAKAVASKSSEAVGSGTACQIRLVALSRKIPVSSPVAGFFSIIPPLGRGV